MRKVLLREIIIPAGTVFEDAPSRIQYAEGCYVTATIGLSENTAGNITYEVSDEVAEWFTDHK